MGFFRGVIKGRRIRRNAGAGTGGQLAGDGQNGEVAVEGATGSADVSEAEAGDLLVVVVVPGVGARVGAPLDHAERERGSGEGVAAAVGANEGVDGVVRERLLRLGCDGGKQGKCNESVAKRLERRHRGSLVRNLN